MLLVTQHCLNSLPCELIQRLRFIGKPHRDQVGFALVAQVQADIPRVLAIYLRTLNMTASTNTPLYVGLASFAPELVRLLFGVQWASSAELQRILAMWGFLRSTINPIGGLLLGMGLADLSLKWNLGPLILIPPVLWIWTYFGLFGLA
jgi:PST family polysaccharide transporter/teichuronic acid exporter/lipopolysaccharide exporter